MDLDLDRLDPVVAVVEPDAGEVATYRELRAVVEGVTRTLVELDRNTSASRAEDNRP